MKHLLIMLLVVMACEEGGGGGVDCHEFMAAANPLAAGRCDGTIVQRCTDAGTWEDIEDCADIGRVCCGPPYDYQFGGDCGRARRCDHP